MRLLVLLLLIVSGCGHSPEEMRIKQQRIDQLTQALDALEASHRAVLDRFKQVADENYQLGLQLVRGGCSPAAAAPAAPASASTSRPPSAPSGKRERTPVAVFEGTGQSNTRPFRVDGPWDFVWAVTGDGGMFSVMAYAASGELAAVLVGQQVGSGTQSGSSYHPAAGTYYLAVISSGGSEWRIEIHDGR